MYVLQRGGREGLLAARRNPSGWERSFLAPRKPQSTPGVTPPPKQGCARVRGSSAGAVTSPFNSLGQGDKRSRTARFPAGNLLTPLLVK